MVPWGALATFFGPERALILAGIWVVYQFKLGPDIFGRETYWTDAKQTFREELRKSNEEVRVKIEDLAENDEEFRGRLDDLRGDMDVIISDVEDLSANHEHQAEALRVLGYTLDPDTEFVVRSEDLDEYLEHNGIDFVELMKRSTDIGGDVSGREVSDEAVEAGERGSDEDEDGDSDEDEDDGDTETDTDT